MILHFLFSLALGVFSAAHATSFYIRPFSEFTQSTPHIVRGHLHDIHTENSITSDGARTIYTYANLEVSEVLKGDLHHKNSITVRKIGGTKDGMTLEVPSSPEFKENEDTVVFLSAEKEDQSYEVLGLELGKFGLVEKNGDATLTGGIFNYSKPGKPGEESEHTQRAKDLAENERPWSLTQLRSLIRSQNPEQNLPTFRNANTAKIPAQASPTSSPISINHEAQQTASPSEMRAEKSTESSNFWLYSAVILVLTSGAFFFLRKK